MNILYRSFKVHGSLAGYIGDGENCDDENECDKSDTCDKNAGCVNTDGSYECSCYEGYEGDGHLCTGKVHFITVERYDWSVTFKYESDSSRAIRKVFNMYKTFKK